MIANNTKIPFYLGDWCVIPEQCRLQNNEASHHIQPKLMEVLLYLAEHPMHVISTDELIQVCWMGQPMTDNPIHKTIAQLRKALGDSSESPKYIKTIPRKGYMLIAKVSLGKSSNNQIEPYWREQVPFVGAHAFQFNHQEIFFGREQSQADLLKYIERIDHSDNLLINLSGVSGCGKSSFINAGIIPKLLNPYKPFKLQFVDVISWQASTDNSIIDLLDVLYKNKLFNPTVSIDDIHKQWKQQPKDLYKLLNSENGDSKQRTVLFIDQMEKWLVLDSDAAKNHGRIDELLGIIVQLNSSKKFLVILSARDEASKVIKNLPAYQPLAAETMDFRLPEMKVADHKGWIQSTMQAAGLFFEVNPNRHETLLELLVHSIERHRCSLTIVQSVLFNLYERRDNSKFQYASFHDLGGIEGMMDHHFEQIFLQLNGQQQKTLIDMFPRLVAFKSILDTKPVVRQIQSPEAIKSLGKPLIDQLIDHRLLFSEQITDQVFISLSERSLPLLWQRLSKWISDNQNSLLKQSEVQFMTARWLFQNKETDYLMSHKDLIQLNKAKQQEYYLTEEQRHYLAASKQKANRKNHVKRSLQLLRLLFLWGAFTLLQYGYKEQLNQQQTQQLLSSLTGYITTELNPQLKAKGELSLLETTNLELLNVIQQTAGTNQSQQDLITHAAALNVLGELGFNHRQFEQAFTYFSQSEKIINQSDPLNHPKLLEHLMLSQYWLGYLGFNENKFNQAKVHWQSYLDTSLRLRELQPDHTEWQLEHSYALNNLGSLSERLGELKQAADYFEQSIDIKTQLLTTQPDNMSLLADLADSLSWQGKIFRKQGALKQALVAYKNSAELTQQMKSEKGKNNTKLHREVLALHRMATVVFDMGKSVESLELAKSALDKSILLNQLELQNNSYKKELVILHLLNANIHRNQLDFDQSLKHIQKANQLIDYFKINLTMTSQIAAYQMLLKREQALIFDHFGHAESAMTAIEDGLSTWEEHELKHNQLAQVTYVMLNLDSAQLIKKNLLSQPNQQPQESIQSHLDLAWQEINNLLSQSPEDRQLMAISLAISFARTGKNTGHKFIQPLIESEYRNPEYYQPLIDDQLISFN